MVRSGSILITMIILHFVPIARAAEMLDLDDEQLENYLLIEEAAHDLGAPRELALAMAHVESDLRDVSSRSGSAVGPLQVHVQSLTTAIAALVRRSLNARIRQGIEIMVSRLKQAHGSSSTARIMYVCGRAFARSCSRGTLERVRTKWKEAARQWSVRDVYEGFGS